MAEKYVTKKNVRNLFAARLHQTALNNDELDYVYEDIVDNRLDIWLNEIPAADVVEVVRCKNCAMYKRDKELAEANYCDPNFYCGLLRTEMDEDGYCSYGRRKDE